LRKLPDRNKFAYDF